MCLQHIVGQYHTVEPLAFGVRESIFFGDVSSEVSLPLLPGITIGNVSSEVSLPLLPGITFGNVSSEVSLPRLPGITIGNVSMRLSRRFCWLTSNV